MHSLQHYCHLLLFKVLLEISGCLVVTLKDCYFDCFDQFIRLDFVLFDYFDLIILDRCSSTFIVLEFRAMKDSLARDMIIVKARVECQSYLYS